MSLLSSDVRKTILIVAPHEQLIEKSIVQGISHIDHVRGELATRDAVKFLYENSRNLHQCMGENVVAIVVNSQLRTSPEDPAISEESARIFLLNLVYVGYRGHVVISSQDISRAQVLATELLQQYGAQLYEGGYQVVAAGCAHNEVCHALQACFRNVRSLRE